MVLSFRSAGNGVTRGDDEIGVLIEVENIVCQAYLMFSSIDDENVRGGKRLFMVALIASKINYFNSLQIKEVLKAISNRLKLMKNIEHWNDQNIDLMIYWDAISKILQNI